MPLGKKKLAIAIALGTLVLALLSLTTIGSASKCSTNCPGSESPEQWLASKAGFKDTVKHIYAASEVSPIKSTISEVSATTQVAPHGANGKVSKGKDSSTDRDAENFRKALVAILLVVATESIQQPISH